MLAWPAPPGVLATLVAAVVVATLFLGIGTLTQQRWLPVLGVVVAVGVLVVHVVRYQRAEAARRQAQQTIGARLMSRCRASGGPEALHSYTDEVDWLVLALTDNALHLCQAEPLEIFMTLPLYSIGEVQVAEPAESKGVVANRRAAGRNACLQLAARMGEHAAYRMTFCNFEPNAPAPLWGRALARPEPSAL